MLTALVLLALMVSPAAPTLTEPVWIVSASVPFWLIVVTLLPIPPEIVFVEETFVPAIPPKTETLLKVN
jgi:hypothetical protein